MIPHIYITDTGTTPERVHSHYKKEYGLRPFSEIYIRPLEDKHELKLDQLKDIRHIVRYAYTKNLLISIDAVDRSSKEVQNSLLKILEEHQNTIHIILMVCNIHSLVPTILSRCKIIDISENKTSLPENGTANKDGAKLTLDHVDAFIISRSQKAKTITELRYLLQFRQLLLNNNVAPQTVYDSVLNFYQKNDSINV